MSVDYDSAYCRAFVQRMQDTLDEADLCALWIYMAFAKFNGTVEDAPTLNEATVLAREFDKMSRWNKQGVLYALVPVLERVAAKKAHEMAQRARKKEPL